MKVKVYDLETLVEFLIVKNSKDDYKLDGYYRYLVELIRSRVYSRSTFTDFEVPTFFAMDIATNYSFEITSSFMIQVHELEMCGNDLERISEMIVNELVNNYLAYDETEYYNNFLELFGYMESRIIGEVNKRYIDFVVKNEKYLNDFVDWD